MNPTPELTFNVIFTPGTVARLLPFALSFLQSPDARVRLVANACPAEEVELLRAIGAREDRLSHHVLAFEQMARHGLALNELFERFPEPHFAFADSDVIASGDFMARLGTPAPGQAGLFAGPRVWMTDAERRGNSQGSMIGSSRQFLADGTYVGNSYCAVYDRAALEPAWRAAPLGFEGHYAHQIPWNLRRSLANHGWRVHWLDTGRLINLQLLAAGYELVERQVPELHHVGGLTYRNYRPAPGWSRPFREILHKEPDRNRLRRIAEGISMRRHNRQQRDPSKSLLYRRRDAVWAHLDEVIDAVLAGDPLPPALTTDSPDVDGQLADLVATLETEYRRGAAVVAEAQAAALETAP